MNAPQRALLCIGVIASGCAHAQPVRSDAVIWSASRCAAPAPGAAQTAGVAPMLISLVGVPLVQAGIKAVGEAIEAAGKPKDTHVFGTTETYLYSGSEATKSADGATAATPAKPTKLEISFRQPCIAMAFGRRQPNAEMSGRTLGAEFDKGNVAPLNSAGALSDDAKTLDKVIDADHRTLIVARIEPSVDQTAFRFVPVYIAIGRPIRADRVKERAVAVTLSLLSPGAAAEGTAVAVRTISIPKVGASKTMRLAEAATLTTSWMPLPAVPASVAARMEAAGKRLADRNTLAAVAIPTTSAAQVARRDAALKRLDEALEQDAVFLRTVAPYSWRGDLHEVEPGSKTLVSLGKALSGSAEKIATSIGDAVDPEKRATKAEKDLQAVEALRVTAIAESANWAKAKTAGETAAAEIAEIKTRAACRQLEAAGFEEVACVVTP